MVGPWEFQLGHVGKVHAVQAENHGRDRQDRPPARQPFHHFVLFNGDQRQVHVHRIGQHFAHVVDVADHLTCMILNVPHVGTQLLRDHLFMQANELVTDFVHRPCGIAQRQQVPPQGIDVLDGGLIKLRFEHVGFDAFDARLEFGHYGAVVIHHKVQHRIQCKAGSVAQLLLVFLRFGSDRRIAG
ncbi:hypothetical protein D3C79_571310 [compost metagenome]